MDKQLARQVLRVAFASGRELESILPALKAQCAAEEYQTYARDIARAIDGITVAFTNKVLAMYPDLADEIENNLKRSERAI